VLWNYLKYPLDNISSLLQQKKVAVSALAVKTRAPHPRVVRKAEPSASDVAMSAASRRLFSRSFVIWREMTGLSARAKDFTRNVYMQYKKRAFVFWKYTIALRRGFSSLATRMQISCSKRALSLWLSRARFEKNSLHSISNRCRLRFLHFVISSWKIVGRIDALACNWRLKRHFALWNRALPIIWMEQDRDGSLLNQHRATRSSFSKWRSFVHRNKRLLQLLLRGQLLYCKHLLVVVWTSWRLVTAAASLRHGTIKRLYTRRKMRSLGDAFSCWTSYLCNIRLLRRVFRAAAERWHLVLTLNSDSSRSDVHVMADHFSAWQLDTKATKQERLLKSIYATAVVYQSIRRRRTILHSWNRWAYCRFTARKQFLRAQSALLRGIVSTWASLAVVTKALTRRVEVRHRRKRLESCISLMRAAVQSGKCRRGPLARRYFGALKWYAQCFCLDTPQQHRFGVLRRLVIQAWSLQRLLSLKIALCIVVTSRHVLRRKFIAWIAHTGNRKRSMISHRLAHAHSTHTTKKRVFLALKRRLSDAAVYFFLLGKAMLSNSRRCLLGGFQAWKTAAAMEREQRVAPDRPGQATAETALLAVSEAPVQASFNASALLQAALSSAASNVEQTSTASKSVVDAMPSEARAAAKYQAAQQPFRAIPVTVSHSSSASTSGQAAATFNAANSRQRLFRENIAPRRLSTPGSKVAETAHATHGTQTLARSKPQRPPLVVERVPQKAAAAGKEVVVVGRAVVSSFLLSDARARTSALTPPASPRLSDKSAA
jgi:hypothetical protein